MSIGISAKTRCNTSEFVDLLLSFEEMGRKSGMCGAQNEAWKRVRKGKSLDLAALIGRKVDKGLRQKVYIALHLVYI